MIEDYFEGADVFRRMKADEQTIEAFRKKIGEGGFPELSEKLVFGEVLKSHTSFRIGGPAQIYAEPESEQEVIALIRAAKATGLPYFLMGNGSNLVVSDKGIYGLVIHLGDKFSDIRLEEDPQNKEIVYMHVCAGALLIKASSVATRNSLSGLEFASGIPGSVGGAVFMNAGAYDHDMSEIVESASCVSEDGEVFQVLRGDFEYGYRTSRFMKNGGIVLSAVLKLTRGNQEEIESQIRTYTEKRTKSQPLNLPSAGSMFKRPVGYYAGTLIQDAGLKGFTVGGAQVSEKHAGFVVNIGNATADDIDQLTKKVRAVILEKNGVTLEREVRFVGVGYTQEE